LSNDNLFPITNLNDTPKTDHIYVDVFTPKGWSAPSWPLLVLSFFFLFINIFSILTNWLWDKLMDQIGWGGEFKENTKILKYEKRPILKMNPDRLNVQERSDIFWKVLR